MGFKRSINAASIYWHDYETFGANPKTDRPAQFAGIRTDLELNIIGEPLVIYAKPATDFLPNPEACLITGITPQHTIEHGLAETEFIGKILKEFSQPNTCVAGYNSIRFDDEFTRYSLYRNLHDPYAREWQNGNSRWDIIDLVRVTNALRPDGIEWPKRENGAPSFRLEELTRTNGIIHESAHDALSDVYATIAMAKLIKEKQPRLYDYVFQHRSKRKVAELLDMENQKPVLHTSSMFPAETHCTTLVVPLIQHPRNNNGVVCFDLRSDPSELLSLDVSVIRERLYTPAKELSENQQRIALKTIHINKCPIIVPAKLDDSIEQRLKIDKEACLKHLSQIRKSEELIDKLVEVFDHNPFEAESDPDYALYSGAFFSDYDKSLMRKIHTYKPASLVDKSFDFEDERLDTLYFRYRARNYPEFLLDDEKSEWHTYCQSKLLDDDSPYFNVRKFSDAINRLKQSNNLTEQQRNLLDKLKQYADALINSLSS